ncbi:MerR family transcriptional regulator [Couchioplanes caeruleus]|uniref:MerR family transcriptional regulator n=1 Tax=Couchioplanes caeruleus TaxID=56438 RepID=UPI00201BAFD3|nr:MerR family transcriptional regulator [Couchioplanes caeruleus]UQU67737.1 MerR family transcriptional regulator [Couchioplanes caeruleus]
MRIGELSRRSGIVIPTIKYYLRTGLLPPGVPRARNQADYGPGHLRRLNVVDALLRVGGMSVPGVHAVLAAIDDTATSPAGLITAVEEAVSARHPRGVDERYATAGARVAATLDRQGWHPPGTALRERLTEACAVADVLDLTDLWPVLDRYAATAAEAAGNDLAVLWTYATRRQLDRDPADPVLREAVVVVAVLGAVVQSVMTGIARHEALRQLLAE